ncbi:MAG: glycosyltransferase [Deltaproteobacteria bacterium]
MARRLRVAQLIEAYDIGGIERMVEGLVPAFASRGIDTVVAGYRHDGPVRPAILALGAPAVLVQGRQGLDPVLPFRLARWIRASQADLLHTHHLGPFIYGVAAARLAGVPHVHTEHSHHIYDSGRRRAVGRSMDGLADVVAVSEEVAAWRHSTLGRRCAVILNGVSMPPVTTLDRRASARGAMGVDDGDVVVGCVARLAPEKDHSTLLRALHAALPSAPSLRLVVVGDGPERPAIESLAAELGVASRVVLLGSRSDVSDLLPGMDLFTLSSRNEGLPLALLEALAAGVPAITTAVGEMPRVLSGGGGYTVPAGDPGALSQALVRAALEPEWRQEVGRAGRAMVHATYSMDSMADAYAARYHAMIDARRAA